MFYGAVDSDVTPAGSFRFQDKPVDERNETVEGTKFSIQSDRTCDRDRICKFYGSVSDSVFPKRRGQSTGESSYDL